METSVRRLVEQFYHKMWNNITSAILYSQSESQKVFLV